MITRAKADIKRQLPGAFDLNTSTVSIEDKRQWMDNNAEMNAMMNGVLGQIRDLSATVTRPSWLIAILDRVNCLAPRTAAWNPLEQT